MALKPEKQPGVSDISGGNAGPVPPTNEDVEVTRFDPVDETGLEPDADDPLLITDEEEIEDTDDDDVMVAHAEDHQAGEDDLPHGDDRQKMHRVVVMTPHAIVNGHRLDHGHVIEMNWPTIFEHRRKGVAISDPLPEDDKREVTVDVTEPFRVTDSESAA